MLAMLKMHIFQQFNGPITQQLSNNNFTCWLWYKHATDPKNETEHKIYENCNFLMLAMLKTSFFDPKNDHFEQDAADSRTSISI